MNSRIQFHSLYKVCGISKYSGVPFPLAPGWGRGEISASLFFRSKTMKKEALAPSKNLHGKNQRVCKNQRSRHEEMTFTIRDNLVD